MNQTSTQLALLNIGAALTGLLTPCLSHAQADTPDASISTNDDEPVIQEIVIDQEKRKSSRLASKLFLESSADKNPQAITTHKLNYFIPFSYNNNPNPRPRNSNGISQTSASELDNLEAKFQVSFKAPIFEFNTKIPSKLYFAFTAQSYWQVYNRDNSAPFRETNYEPELYWTVPFTVKFLPNKVNMAGIGFSHQSNGQNVPASRSWNRIFANFEWENGDWIFQFKPWYRIPEKTKSDPSQVAGDDNPDIEKYMGHFELRAFLVDHRNAVSLMVRNNLRSDNKGALQFDWNFPTKYAFKPYVQVFVGYGESLIDYNVVSRRVSMGILLKEWP